MVSTHHHSHPISLIIIHPKDMRWHPLHHRLCHPSHTRHRGPIPHQCIHLHLCLPRILGFSPSSCCTGAPPRARATPSWVPLSHSSLLFLKWQFLEMQLRHTRWVEQSWRRSWGRRHMFAGHEVRICISASKKSSLISSINSDDCEHFMLYICYACVISRGTRKTLWAHQICHS